MFGVELNDFTDMFGIFEQGSELRDNWFTIMYYSALQNARKSPVLNFSSL